MPNRREFITISTGVASLLLSPKALKALEQEEKVKVRGNEKLEYFAAIAGEQKKEISDRDVHYLELMLTTYPSLFIVTKSEIDNFKPRFPNQRLYSSLDEITKTIIGRTYNNGLGALEVDMEGNILSAQSIYGYIESSDKWENNDIPTLNHSREDFKK
ncbi:hypothetical protein CL617_05455 [archaeon]|nr:hypothetical protein [archaeon]|tara:strand:+ start:953 stop:1426 length:474 start_codon:yes stop_codon:yes gene_type:complete